MYRCYRSVLIFPCNFYTKTFDTSSEYKYYFPACKNNCLIFIVFFQILFCIYTLKYYTQFHIWILSKVVSEDIIKNITVNPFNTPSTNVNNSSCFGRLALLMFIHVAFAFLSTCLQNISCLLEVKLKFVLQILTDWSYILIKYRSYQRCYCTQHP